MKRTKTKEAVAISLKAKIVDENHVDLSVTDLRTGEVFGFILPFRKLEGGMLTLIKASEEEATDGK